MKFCIDCKHLVPTKYSVGNIYYCSHPKLLVIDRVTGGTSYRHCSTLREGLDKCGEKGKFWEKKNDL